MKKDEFYAIFLMSFPLINLLMAMIVGVTALWSLISKGKWLALIQSLGLAIVWVGFALLSLAGFFNIKDIESILLAFVLWGLLFTYSNWFMRWLGGAGVS